MLQVWPMSLCVLFSVRFTPLQVSLPEVWAPSMWLLFKMSFTSMQVSLCEV